MAKLPVSLLDVNVLVALFFADHVHHDFAHDWFEDHQAHGWATCPHTVNGFVRVACRQTIDGDPVRPAVAVDLLRRFTAHTQHTWWPDSISLVDVSAFLADEDFLTLDRHLDESGHRKLAAAIVEVMASRGLLGSGPAVEPGDEGSSGPEAHP